jgi:hypothetical protein
VSLLPEDNPLNSFLGQQQSTFRGTFRGRSTAERNLKQIQPNCQLYFRNFAPNICILPFSALNLVRKKNNCKHGGGQDKRRRGKRGLHSTSIFALQCWKVIFMYRGDKRWNKANGALSGDHFRKLMIILIRNMQHFHGNEKARKLTALGFLCCAPWLFCTL